MNPRRYITLFIAAASLVSCGQIEREPLTDADGEVIPVPAPYDDWLSVSDFEPAAETLAPRPTLVLQFSDYLEDDRIRSYDFAELRSGGRRSLGISTYVMTDKAVIWRPYGELERGLKYKFEPLVDLRSYAGSPPLPGDFAQRTFMVAEDGGSATLELPEPTWSDVDEIIERRCAECHRNPDRRLDPLSYESLVGRRSQQTDRFLVRPGDAPDSYLMQKLLWDYRDIEFTHQPPPWAENAEQLPREELLVIERWIENGVPH